ncbi:4947_t:CDS:2 [Cetraspora pellucida]|uniref:4947_t:CDS:1 n=1 Tax=Cetraspora pellucida TaxID=1433469 RepID=A0ACA9L936_9GLOM|nr:4947_t:CDS:2 [Cetraspora pellucida]
MKVENLKIGDSTRTWGQPWATNKDPNDRSTPASAYFLSISRNKNDILVENYIPRKLDKMGLGFNELSKINPQLIYASITGKYSLDKIGYGQTGPYSNHAGYDVVIEAEASLMYITGEEDDPPVKFGVAITVIMAALISRSKPNLGQRIDCSLEYQIASLANIASNYLISNHAKRMGTSHPSIVPYKVFPMKDELINDPRFTTNSDRVLHRKELVSLLEEGFKNETTDHWLSLLSDKEIPLSN